MKEEMIIMNNKHNPIKNFVLLKIMNLYHLMQKMR